MKKLIQFSILIFFTLIIFLAPVDSFADTASSPAQLDVQYKYPWAGAASPADFISRFYKIALGAVGAAAFGILIYGAVLWTVSGAISSKQDAIEWIWAAVWGLVLLLGAYLILNTINPNLIQLRDPQKLPPPATGGLVPPANASGGLTEEQSRQAVAAAGAGVKSICPINQSVGCVNLNGVRKSTLDEVLSLVSGVGGANVFITAGTEGCGTIHSTGIYSHCTGYKIDLRLNVNLNSYITQNFQKISNRSDGAAQYQSPSGAVYALENDHWDIVKV